MSVPAMGLGNAWIVGGGYKYLQLGEGNCFLRMPPRAAELRPVITGWFAEFDALADASDPNRTAYSPGAARFAGSTYDPTSHYRAARVFRFFAERGLTAPLLRASYLHQVGRLATAFDALDLPDAVVTRDRVTPPAAIGGFLALETPHAARLHDALLDREVHTDHRGQYLRFGPAPYLADAQLDAAMAALGEAAATL
jgi:kynureninase